MAVVQISKIQLRRGKKLTSGLPQLASGELAWAIDTQELYIGNGAVAMYKYSISADSWSTVSVTAARAAAPAAGMTADWVHLPYEFLMKISNEIINNVRGVNRVVYDISSKPPATIEWE